MGQARRNEPQLHHFTVASAYEFEHHDLVQISSTFTTSLQIVRIPKKKRAAFYNTNHSRYRVDCDAVQSSDDTFRIAPSLEPSPAVRPMTLHLRPTGWADSLLLGESLHRGYPSGPLRRQQARGERHHSHYERSTCKDCQIKSRHMEKHRLHGPACQPGSHDT